MKKPLIIIALLALILPGALLAQDDLTLSGLAQQLAALTDKVTTTNTDISILTAAQERSDRHILELRDRIREVERWYQASSQHPLRSKVVPGLELGCEIGSHDGFATNKMHAETYISFIEIFSE